MNILYVNHYAGSIYHGMEYRPYYLAKTWVQNGHKVTIVACNYSHVRQTNIDITDGNYREEMVDGIRYIWYKSLPYKGNGLARFMNILLFLKNVRKDSNRLLQLVNPDVIIASSTYPFDIKVAYNIAKKAKAKLVYEVHDLWPLSPIEVGGMSKYHPFIYLTQYYENYAYKKADKVVSLLPDAKNYMQLHGMASEKFVYIPNGVVVEQQDSHVSLPLVYQQQLDELRLKYKFLIGYAGGMANGNSLRCAIDAMYKITKLKSSEDKNTNNSKNEATNYEIVLVLLGDGIYKQDLQQMVREYQLNNVVFFAAILKTYVPTFLLQMDALFVGFPKLALYRFGVSPNKLFDYMLAKKPIVCAITASNNMVVDANCGITVEADNATEIANAFRLLSQMSREELERLGDNGYKYVLQHHDYKVLATKFINVVQ